jgi:hypothetical protein
VVIDTRAASLRAAIFYRLNKDDYRVYMFQLGGYRAKEEEKFDQAGGISSTWSESKPMETCTKAQKQAQYREKEKIQYITINRKVCTVIIYT